jgi:triosephosphate isomerase
MLIAGNWKMNTDRDEAVELARTIIEAVGESSVDVKIAVCPPFVNLDAVSTVAKGSVVRLGAQNMHAAASGAYTGEVSAAMLTALGCHYVIIGHSERRQYFGESDLTVNQKVHSAVAAGLVPIICVGESLEQRESNRQNEVVGKQLTVALNELSDLASDQLVVAYEPVWAIGTGRTASPEQAQEMHAMIRKILVATFGQDVGGSVDILYGGSMKPGNAEELLAMPDVNGGLIGGAGLKADQFAQIVEAARNAV